MGDDKTEIILQNHSGQFSLRSLYTKQGYIFSSTLYPFLVPY